MQDGRKLRLIGINAPELARKHEPEQAFAQQARLELMALLRQANYRVMLEFGHDLKDKYQRTLAHIYLPNGRNLQQALLEKGLATAFTTPPNAQQSICYQLAERQARQAALGIWRLAEYQTKPVASLGKHDRGFRIVRGKVSAIYTDHKGTSILLDNKLRLSIRKSDLIYFPPGYLLALKSRHINVRGWLHPRQNQFFMSLRHPDAISSGKQ